MRSMGIYERFLPWQDAMIRFQRRECEIRLHHRRE